MVDHVRRETGYDKVAFIGHSQGNATMFCSLGALFRPFGVQKVSLTPRFSVQLKGWSLSSARSCPSS